ncbi:MAG: hypothetical protein KJ069_21350 [Anaerolineae bacterium]|nr:hypothetical protein [Anaerolineae bacterium]
MNKEVPFGQGRAARRILTYTPGWTVREECFYFDLGGQICINVPDIVEIGWLTGTSGKYTLLLEVKDTVGNTYFDIQRVWVDSDNVSAQITSLGGLAPCVDLKLSDYVNQTAEIRGVAWDSPIVDTDPPPQPPAFQQRPSWPAANAAPMLSRWASPTQRWLAKGQTITTSSICMRLTLSTTWADCPGLKV